MKEAREEKTLRIGTRPSRLAMQQAGGVAERLRAVAAPRAVELVEVETVGDRQRDVPLAGIGGEGVFTKEIQRALLDGRVDVAVHSLKDLPTAAVDGLRLAAVPVRAPAADVLISRHASFDRLPPGATLATGSLRRRAQALYRRPDLRFIDIRGNVETRLRRATESDLDGLILAQAGLERLGLAGVITEVLSTDWMLPAVGQGALGLECRADDRVTAELLLHLDDPSTHHAALAERALLEALGGGCLLPIGALAVVADNMVTMRAAVLAPDGSRRVEDSAVGPADRADHVGWRLAQTLLQKGADQILGSSRT